jgi:excisionase family DNA binding protein
MPKVQEVDPDLISIPETAEHYVPIHRDTLYRLARQGKFPPAIKIGNKWLVSVPRLERFLHGEAVEGVISDASPLGS